MLGLDYKAIILIGCAIVLVMLLVYSIIRWGKPGACDNNACVVRNITGCKLFIACLSIAITASFIVALFLLSENNREIWLLPILYGVLIYAATLNIEYRLTVDGIYIRRFYERQYKKLLNWNQVKSWEWVAQKKDILLIDHDKGCLRLRIDEKKELVTALLNKADREP